MLLDVRDVSRHYSVRQGLLGLRSDTVRAVDGVSFSLEKGRTLGLVGESGCGKSTLGRLILALEKPDSGDILLDGRPVAEGGREMRRRVQMVFQDPYSSLNPRKSVGSIVAEPLNIHKVGTRSERRRRTLELLSLVGLSESQAGRYPHEFSGGQRQRVAVARALALDPDLVVCDEPVSALDVSIQAQVLNLLAELQKRLFLTYLFISHDLSVVGAVSDEVAVMYMGRLVEKGPAGAIFETPLHPYTRALLSAVPVPDPDAARERTKLPAEPGESLVFEGGCPFAGRCPEREGVCRSHAPQWREPEPGRFVSCHLHAPSP